MDVHSPAQRSHNMSRIKGKDTTPEMMLRRGLHARGWRYQLHRKNLPGRPDLVFPGPAAVVFVHGCFWHGHDCPMFRLPATRTDFWLEKIAGNQARDARNVTALETLGWRRLIVWECALRGRARRPLEDVLAATETFLRGHETALQLGGQWTARGTQLR